MTTWMIVALTTLGLALSLLLFSLGFRRLYRGLGRWRERERRHRAAHRWEVFQGDEVVRGCVLGSRVLRVVLTLLVVDLYASWVYSLFGDDELFSRPLLSYLAQPAMGVWQGFVAYLPNLFHILAVLLVLWVVLQLIRLGFRAVERGVIVIHGFHTDWARPTYKIVRSLLIVITGIQLFPYLPGANSEYFRGISLFVGALVTLGSSGAISNVIAGLVLIYTRAFQVGQVVRIGDDVGTVTGKNMLVTRLRTPANEEITIPNGLVLARAVTNFNAYAQEEGLALEVAVDLGYEVDWRRGHELLLAAAARVPEVLESPEPFVHQRSLDASSIKYVLHAYVADPSQMRGLQSDLNREVLDAFREAGVEIASPEVSVVRTEAGVETKT